MAGLGARRGPFRHVPNIKNPASRQREAATTGELEAAARQVHVRKITAIRSRQSGNAEAFGHAGTMARESAAATNRLSGTLGVEGRGGPRSGEFGVGGGAAPPGHGEPTPHAQICTTESIERLGPHAQVSRCGHGTADRTDALARCRGRPRPGGSGPARHRCRRPFWDAVGTPRPSRASTRHAPVRLRPAPASPRTRDGFRPRWPRPGCSRVRFALKANPLPEVLEVFRGLGRPGRPKLSASMHARPVSRGAPWRAAGAPTRSATRARTSPSATSTSWCPLRSTSTSTRSASSNATAGGRRARIGCGSIRAPGRLQRAPRVRRGPADQVRHRPRAAGRRMAAAARHHLTIDTVHFHAGFVWLADGLAASTPLRPGRRPRRTSPRRRSPHRRSQRGWRAGCSGPRRTSGRRPRRVRGGAGTAPRSVWGHDRLRTRRLADQGCRDPARRGRDHRAPAGVTFVGLDIALERELS